MVETYLNKAEYWAAASKEDVGHELDKRIEDWYSQISTTGIFRRVRKCYMAYYGFSSTGSGHTASEVTYGGVQGELSLVKVNHLRNIIQHMLVMTTATRPAMDARAVNTDYKSLSQAVLANGILDYYLRERKLERYLRSATEYALVFGEGFIKLEWDSSLGEDYTADEFGRIIHTGDIKFSVHNPLDVIRDVYGFDNNESDWVMIRHFKNRYEMIAKYPELREEILACDTKDRIDLRQMYMNFHYISNSDLISVYEFYHKKSEALPNGRFVAFLDKDAILYDGDLPYTNIPVYRIAPSDFIGTPFGYTSAFDLLAMQDIMDALNSTIVTNQSTFGVQNVMVPMGHSMSVSQLAGGLNFIEYDPACGKPEPLNLTNTPVEIFNYLTTLEKQMETLSGVNSVARGNPEANLRSGNSLALVQSMAIQFNSGLQQSYAQLVEDVGTALIKTLRDFASVERTAMLVGKNNRTYLKAFSGEDLDKIDRVVVDMGNPLSKCLGKNVPILMYDGTTKLSQNIISGDQLMGPDSKLRTVTSVTRGKDEMYRVTSSDSSRAADYSCNKNHILTLKYCSDDYRYGAKKGDIVDISIEDYLKLPNRHQRLLQGFTTGIEFAQAKDLKVPPYILGAWLGDGTSETTAITTMDSEIVNEWTKYATSLGLQIREQANRQPNKSKVYFITSGQSHGKSTRNPFKSELNAMEVIGNKHIPFAYLTATKQNRLELLAGLLDTDGHLIDETFIFTQTNDRLTQDVIQLARSLGFRVTSKKVKTIPSGLVTKECETNKISIGGNTWEIPTRLARKQAKAKEKARDWHNYGITVTALGTDDYYGFILKEESHFILGDFTVTHNTTAGKLEMANNLLQMGLIKTPDQYMTVMKTGNLDTMLEGQQAELLYIKQENEALADGSCPQVMITDLHPVHIIEHKAVVSTVEARENPQVTSAVTKHFQDHIDAMKNADPDLLQMLGMQPLQPGRSTLTTLDPEEATKQQELILQQQQLIAQQQGTIPGAPPGAPGAQPSAGAPAPAPQGPGAPPPMPASPVPMTAQQQEAGVDPARMPKNPLSKNAWNPTTGGL